MDIGLIISVILVIVMIVFILKVIKKVIVAVIYVVLLVIVFTGIVGYLAYSDMVRIDDSKPYLLLLNDRGDIIAGNLVYGPMNYSSLDAMELTEINKLYQEDGIGSILETASRAFIIDSSILDSEDSLEFQGYGLSNNQILQVLRSQSPYGLLLATISSHDNSKNITEELLNQEYGDDVTNLKGTLFAGMWFNYVGKHPVESISAFKEGKIEIHPRTMAVRLADTLPASIGYIKNMISKLLEIKNVNI
ncbi:hypothetical protein K9M79_01675 [Candidatus Woesearchaeota archaeon]|nr:hypothetical protein [Candidatus Woesearchaeota archaeon]